MLMVCNYYYFYLCDVSLTGVAQFDSIQTAFPAGYQVVVGSLKPWDPDLGLQWCVRPLGDQLPVAVDMGAPSRTSL